MGTKALGYQHTCEAHGCTTTATTTSEKVPADWGRVALRRVRNQSQDEIGIKLLCPGHVTEVSRLLGIELEIDV